MVGRFMMMMLLDRLQWVGIEERFEEGGHGVGGGKLREVRIGICYGDGRRDGQRRRSVSGGVDVGGSRRWRVGKGGEEFGRRRHHVVGRLGGEKKWRRVWELL